MKYFNKLFIFLTLLINFTFTFGDNTTTISTTIKPNKEKLCQNGNEENGYWKSISNTKICNIKIQPGYKIRIIIENFSINSNDSSLIQIRPGASSNGKNMILTWNVGKETYLFPTNNLIMELKTNGSRKLGSDESFSIYWEKFGNFTASTEAPTSTESYPTQNPNSTEPYYYTAYLFGKLPEEFKKDVVKFKTLLVEKGNQYCVQNNIPLKNNITLKNIDITLAIRCLYIWPNAEKCIEIHFAIPVFVKNSEKYELSYQHLKELYSTISDAELQKYIGWTKYSTPDDNYTLTTWLIICFVIIFAALLIFLGLQFLGILKFNKRQEITENNTVPTRQFNLDDFYQSTPQLFENENGYPYQQVYSKDNPAFVFDDLSEDERFDINEIRQRANGHIN